MFHQVFICGGLDEQNVSVPMEEINEADGQHYYGDEIKFNNINKIKAFVPTGITQVDGRLESGSIKLENETKDEPDDPSNIPKFHQLFQSEFIKYQNKIEKKIQTDIVQLDEGLQCESKNTNIIPEESISQDNKVISRTCHLDLDEESCNILKTNSNKQQLENECDNYNNINEINKEIPCSTQVTVCLDKNLPDKQLSTLIDNEQVYSRNGTKELPNDKNSVSCPSFSNRDNITPIHFEENSGNDCEQEYFESEFVDADLKTKEFSTDFHDQNFTPTPSSDNSRQEKNDESNKQTHTHPHEFCKVTIINLTNEENNYIIADSSISTNSGNIIQNNNLTNFTVVKPLCTVKVNKKENKQKKITPHHCSICDKYLCDVYNLKKHVQRKHPEDKALLEHIENTGKERRKKRIRVKNASEEEPIFICGVCHKSFETKTQMAHHSKTLCFGFKRPLKYQCDICGKRFRSELKLQDHTNTHTNARPYKCHDCDKWFNSDLTRYLHHKKMHKKIPDLVYLCSCCGIFSKSISHILSHEEFHRLPEGTEDPHLFKCNECGRGYISRYKLRAHIKSSHQKKRCSRCSEIFPKDSLLRRHIREVHKVAKEYKCETCGKVFSAISNLRVHRQTHLGFNKFCEICGKGFKSKGNLSQHMITHSDDRPIPCPDCNECFKRRNHLKQHLSAIHGK